MAQPSTEAALQTIAGKLQHDVPIHVPDRRHIRMWRPVRAGLFSTASMGLVEISPNNPASSGNLHQDKGRFLAEVRDFLSNYQDNEMSRLRESEIQARGGTEEAPFLGLHGQIDQILNGGSRLSDSELPLRHSTEAGHSNAIFDIVRLAHSAPHEEGPSHHVVNFHSLAGEHHLLLLYDGDDLAAAYGRVNGPNGSHHELFLRGAVRSGSPVISFSNGLRSTVDHAEHFELLVVSIPSS